MVGCRRDDCNVMNAESQAGSKNGPEIAHVARIHKHQMRLILRKLVPKLPKLPDDIDVLLVA